MELAVEVMLDSIDERRDDGKACPKVGAVLWRPDGRMETAFRGELRDGDHAEYTLLERKHRDQRLDGSVLFATLEPCAPGSRRHPKLACAERIVLARIKEVWIGIEDPDPTVDRKGIKYLQERGVTVHMFDRDLQNLIREANSDFLAQALTRAEEHGDAEEPPALSSLEEPSSARLSEFSGEALDRYRVRAAIPEPSSTTHAFHSRLVRQGLAIEQNGRLVPSGFGLLLFGSDPRLSMPQAGLLATIRYPDGSEEFEDFSGALVLVPDRLQQWLEGKLPNISSRDRMERRSSPALPFEMIREAIVNALVHRDYDNRQAKTHLVITADTITIKSPGGPVPPITLGQLQSFDAPMLSRNPVVHFVFAQMRLAEERGLGLRSLRDRASAAGLPLPRYTWDDPYLVLTLYRHPRAGVQALPRSVQDSLSEPEQRGWQWVVTRRRAKASDYAEALGVDARTARRHLSHFVDLGLARRVGAGPATLYEVV